MDTKVMHKCNAGASFRLFLIFASYKATETQEFHWYSMLSTNRCAFLRPNV